MSIIGVDFGTASFTVANAAGAGAQRGGITIVLNEGTSRFTPGLVTFHESKRHIGQLAAPLVRAQFRNTVARIKSFIGRKFSDPFVQEELRNIHYTVKEMPNDEIGIEVTHNGEQLTFSPTQIFAMQLGNIVEFTRTYSGKKNVEMVITVPAFFTDAQRRAVRDAAAIANVRLLKLVNESTATALSYGIFRRGKFSDDESKPTNVMFVDMGNTNFSATVVAFTKQGIQVKGCAYERNVGGFYMDKGIADRMADEFQAKTQIDIREKPKSYIKARIAAEKLKKTLSPDGVNVAKSSIECLYQEHDFRFTLTQEDFNTMFQPLADRLERPIREALAMAQLEASDLFAVEMVGGGVRVPIIKRKIAEVLGLDLTATNFGLSATLNQDECVARGGALQCAMLSPSIRVIQYSLKDSIMFPIRISWDPKPGDDESAPSSLEILKKGDPFPAFKKITFNRPGKFTIRVSYSDPENLPSGTNPEIGSFSIGDDATLVAPEDGSDLKIRVIMAFDEDGTFGIRSAEYMQLKMVEEPAPAAEADANAKEGGGGSKAPDGGEATPEAAADGEATPEAGADGDAGAAGGDAGAEGADTPAKEGGEQPASGEGGEGEGEAKPAADAAAAAAPAPAPVLKKKYTPIGLAVSCDGICALTPADLTEARDREARMAQAERILRERDEKRNELETAIYSYRDQSSDPAYCKFATEETITGLQKLLDELEDWIYTEEGFDGQKSLFTDRLDKLHAVGRPILLRKREFDERPRSVEAFHRARVEQLAKINNQDEKYAHLTTEDRDQVRKVWADAEKWLADSVKAQEEKGFTELVLTSADIDNRARTARNECLPVLNKPAPEPEPEPEPEKPAPETEAAASEGAAADGEAAAAEGGGAAADGAAADAAAAAAAADGAGPESPSPAVAAEDNPLPPDGSAGGEAKTA